MVLPLLLQNHKLLLNQKGSVFVVVSISFGSVAAPCGQKHANPFSKVAHRPFELLYTFSQRLHPFSKVLFFSTPFLKG